MGTEIIYEYKKIDAEKIILKDGALCGVMSGKRVIPVSKDAVILKGETFDFEHDNGDKGDFVITTRARLEKNERVSLHYEYISSKSVVQETTPARIKKN